MPIRFYVWVFASLAVVGCGSSAGRGVNSGGGDECPSSPDCSSAEAAHKVKTTRNAQNTSTMEAEVQRYLAAHRLTPINAPAVSLDFYRHPPSSPEDAPTPPAELAKRPERGLGAEERLLARSPIAEDPAGVVFEGPGCLNGSSCGCHLSSMYRVATAADGRVVVLRPAPKVTTERIMQCGSCTTGCGTPAPPTPPVMLRLPVEDAARVEVVDVPYTYVDVVVRCCTEMPAP